MTGAVFVVDDHPGNVALLAQLLRNAGYTVRVANSGRRALAAIASQPTDLVLLDINMPEMSGYEVCAQLKADAATCDIPVIFLSALDDVRDKVSAFQAGGVDYVTKPFQAEEVLARVGAQLGLARMRRELEARNRELEQRNRELARARRDNDGLFHAMAEALPGSTLDGRYRLDAKIGSGGFAVVYRGHDLERDRPIAVKVLHRQHLDDEWLREQFLREGASIMKLANAVEVLASGITTDGVAYLVMELLEGETLADEARRAPLAPGRCASVLVPVCDVLAAAHARGVIHRDIKPANIYLCKDGTVKVLDFGIAKLRDAEAHDVTTVGRLIGTPIYMAPERLAGKAYDERIDVYALGITIYELLAGVAPFRVAAAEGMARLIQACLADAPRPLGELVRDLPAGLETLVHRILAKRADDRPPLPHIRAALAAVAANAAVLDAVPTLDSVRPVKPLP